MDKENLYIDAINKYLGEIQTAENKVFPADEALSYYKEVSEETLINVVIIVVCEIERNERGFKNANSAFHLSKAVTEAGILLLQRGCFAAAKMTIVYLKNVIFRCHVINRSIGYRLERGVYRGAGISNVFVKDNPMYFDVFRKAEIYGDYEIDSIHLTKVFASFILKKMDEYHYEDFALQNELKGICEKYDQFRSYVDNDREKHRDQAEILFKESIVDWPAFAYSLAEIYSRYDTRVRIARNITDSPQIAEMRYCEKEGHEKELKKKAFRKRLIKVLICLAVIAFIVYKVFTFFAGHPERQGIAALIIILLVFLSVMGDDPILWFLFFWL